MSSSVDNVVAPVIRERFSSRWSCSFLSVPHPGGKPDKQPFWMCKRKFSISFAVYKFPRGLLGTFTQRSMRKFRFFSSCSLSGVFFNLAEPWSSSCLKICVNSCTKAFAIGSAFLNVFVILWTAWNKSSLTSTPGKNYSKSLLVKYGMVILGVLNLYDWNIYPEKVLAKIAYASH